MNFNCNPAPIFSVFYRSHIFVIILDCKELHCIRFRAILLGSPSVQVGNTSTLSEAIECIEDYCYGDNNNDE